MTALYEITRNRDQLERLAETGEIDPESMLAALEALDGELKEKAVNVAAFIRNLEASAKAIREAGKQMLERAARVEKRAESVRAYLLLQLEFARVPRIEDPRFVISIKKNPASVVIDDEALLPAGYFTVPDPPAPRPDKFKIRDAITAGTEVPGARLIQSDRLDIREG